MMLAVMASAQFAAAQGIPGMQMELPSDGCAREKAAMVRRELPPRTQWAGTFHVVKYDLFMDWRVPLADFGWGFTGVNKITIVIDSASQSAVTLDATAMFIDTVRVNGTLVPAVQPVNEAVELDLDRAHAPGDTVVIAISYTRTLEDYVGFYKYDKDLYVGQSQWGDSVFLPERLAYTMSEPRDAHYWMPCVDDPSMKALAEIRVLVPAGFQVSSNGRLKSHNTTAAGTLWDWVENEPIATYLMCATASKFAMWHDNYVRITNAADTVPIEYYTWKVDSSSTDVSGRQYNATYSFRNMPKIVAGYSQRFGEYPFTKYGMTPVQPFAYGGMEHQTMTTITRVWLRGTSEMGIAHELMHQWFGDNITCGTWKDIWLNEGFATYGEAIYAEIMGGKSYYDVTVGQQMTDYKRSNNNRTTVYDPEGQGLNVFNWGTTYRKGGAVLHMLRGVLGDTLFFNTMKAYQAHFRFGHATTAEFADFISQSTGQDLHWFVDEWIFGSWHPQYAVDAVALDDNHNNHSVKLTIDQPDQTRPLFRMPIQVRLYTAGGVIDEVVSNQQRSQQFTLATATRVDSVSFDPGNWILKDSTILHFSRLVGVAQGALPGSAQLVVSVAPNPADAQTVLTWAASTNVRGTVNVIDMLGRTVATFNSATDGTDIVHWDTRDVAPGTYAVRVSTPIGVSSTMVRVIH